jgi:P-type Ca2+ transporter type 2C
MHSGLTSEEVNEKLKHFGYNELAATARKNIGRIALEVVREPMFLLLISCGVLYIVLGDYKEGIVLMSSILIIVVITFIQYRKTERALEALRSLSAPRALVLRDGKEIRIPGREIVPGDLIILHEGDRIAADCKLISTVNLTVDESLLTGESVPAQKSENSTDDLIFSGTLVVQGKATAQVIHTGQLTKFGIIGASLESIQDDETRLQREMKVLIRTLFIAGMIISILVVLMFYLTRGQFVQSLLNGLAAAMAILPEEFPVVLTVFLALGSWRLSSKKVLTRKAAAIETLGSATVLCSDKTGTITENKMVVAAVFVNGEMHQRSNFSTSKDDVGKILNSAALASHADSIDPMERSIAQARNEISTSKQEEVFVSEFPLSPQMLAMTMVYQNQSDEFISFSKGAPEAIADLCGMNPGERNEVLLQVKSLASSGYRVLGVAQSIESFSEIPQNQRQINHEFVGLLALHDPIREEVPAAIAECRDAGIRVIMITGDYPATAIAIGQGIGMNPDAEVMTGADLDQITDEELQKRIQHVNIFARVVPVQKLRIVKALKANGEIVAMTGDGVNDAPALKAANIGIAMGAQGTDVAREASSLVLLDDNFASIVAAIRSGRRIFDNLQKAMSYIMAIHIPIIGLTLIPAFYDGMMLILLPLHIVFMELIIDPVCSVAFEAEQEERDIMKRKPRDPEERFFGRKKIVGSVVKGGLLLLMVLVIYFLSVREGHTEGEVRAITFSALIVGNIFLILAELSKTRSFVAVILERNYFTIGIIVLAVSILLLVIAVPSLNLIFSFDFPGYGHFIPSITGAIILLLILEANKLYQFRKTRIE